MTRSARTLAVLITGLSLLLSLALTTTTATAAEPADPQVDPPASHYAVITVTDVDKQGNVLATATMRTAKKPVGTPLRSSSQDFDKARAMDTGSGGFPSASGCRTLTVKNVTKTFLGYVAFKFVTEVGWCWKTATNATTINHIAAYPQDVDSQYQWRGVVEAWTQTLSGGKKVYRQGHFQNCILNKGCIGSYYPSNTSTVTSTGMWSWKTNG